MANQGINMPGGFGGLTHFNEEYKSKFMLKPSHIIILVVIIIGIRLMLPRIF